MTNSWKNVFAQVINLMTLDQLVLHAILLYSGTKIQNLVPHARMEAFMMKNSKLV